MHHQQRVQGDDGARVRLAAHVDAVLVGGQVLQPRRRLRRDSQKQDPRQLRQGTTTGRMEPRAIFVQPVRPTQMGRLAQHV